MRLTRQFLGAAALFLAGCHTYPYHPYSGGYGPNYGPGYAPAPGYAPPPGGYMTPTPSPTYVPQNNLSPGNSLSPTPLSAPNTSPKPNFRPDDGNNAPQFNPNPTEKLVPDPMDPGFGNPGAFNAPPQRLPTMADGSEPGGVQPVSGIETDPFESPQPLNPSGDGGGLSLQPSKEAVAKRPNPYAFDGKEYKWLRGIVDYDEHTQTWSIIYALVPDASDPYGGSVVFAPDDQLALLRPGDTVLVEGRFDSAIRDRAGKPAYRVSKITPVIPKSE